VICCDLLWLFRRGHPRNRRPRQQRGRHRGGDGGNALDASGVAPHHRSDMEEQVQRSAKLRDEANRYLQVNRVLVFFGYLLVILVCLTHHSPLQCNNSNGFIPTRGPRTRRTQRRRMSLYYNTPRLSNPTDFGIWLEMVIINRFL